MPLHFSRSACFALWLAGAASVSAQEYKITLKAGEFDRTNTVVEFTAPATLRGNFALRASDGSFVQFQIDQDGHAVFIEPKAGKGTSKTYTITPLRAPEGRDEKSPDAPVRFYNSLLVRKEGAVVKVTKVDGAPLFHYQAEPGPVPTGVDEAFKHGAFLHPVFSPNGRVVTANHPPDHLHQRGIFFGWTKSEFEGGHPDFWNMGKGPDGKLTGEVRFTNLDRTWDGTVQAGFASRHKFLDHTSSQEKEVLEETWKVTATQLPKANLIDFDSVQTITGKSPLLLPKYFYGGLGVRGAADWDPVDKVIMLTSNGDDRKAGDNSKAKWVHLGGLINGEPAGIAVLIHPENFRFPQPLRLNPKNPQLSVAPSQEGDWEISPGKPYRSRYRFVITDNTADAAEIERQWNDYATPPTVEVIEANPGK